MRTSARFRSIVGVLAIVLVGGSAASAERRASPEQVMIDVRDLDDGHDRQAAITMVMVESGGEKRTRVMRFWAMDGSEDPASKEPAEMRMLRIDSPANIADTAFLIHSYPEALDRDDDQWIYLPALRQTRRIATTEKDGSFMGSNFAYADLERVHVREFTYKNMPDATVAGRPCWVIEATAANERIVSKTGYSKKLLSIWKDHAVILQNTFFDRTGKPLKRFSALKVEPIQGKWTTTQMKMEHFDSKRQTFLFWSDIRYDVGMKAGDFNQAELGKH